MVVGETINLPSPVLLPRFVGFVVATSIVVAGFGSVDGSPSTTSTGPVLEVLERPASIEPPDVANAVGQRIVYLNFDGVTLTGSSSQDDGPTNQTAIPVTGGVIRSGETITFSEFRPSTSAVTEASDARRSSGE